MTAVELPQPRVEPKRDRWGRYLIPDGSGKYVAYTRATTVASTLDDRHALEKWQQRMVALGLVARSDLYAAVAASHDDKDRLNKLCAEALEAAKGSAAATLGTSLHSFTERVDRGEQVHIPAPWDADVAAYQQALVANGVHVIADRIENIVLLDGPRVAGTFDRLVKVDGRALPMVADLKTGSTLDFSWCAIAAQLAIYARADRIYDPVTDTTEPMVPVDQHYAVVIHLPAGSATCTLHMVDLDAGWEAVSHCLWTREWRKRKNLAQPFQTSVAQRARVLEASVQRMKDDHPAALAELAAMWPDGVPTFRQGGPRTTGECDLVALAVSVVAARHGLPFGEPDPLDRQAPAAAVAGLLERMTALPDDLRDAVSKVGVDLGIPNLRHGRLTVGQFDHLDGLLRDAETAAASRLTDAKSESETA